MIPIRVISFVVLTSIFFVNAHAQNDLNMNNEVDLKSSTVSKKGLSSKGTPSYRALPVADGNVGIGQSFPRASLEILGELRVGSAGVQWSPDSIGLYSVAFGLNTLASGLRTAAWGNSTRATGKNATAWGDGSVASAWETTAFGNQTTASANYSTAMGIGTIASGVGSTAMGSGSIASGTNTTAMGSGSKASGFKSTAMGSSTSSGHTTTSTGLMTKAAGKASLTSGQSTQSNGYASAVIGMYNDTIVGVQFAVSNTTPLFIVGNGNSDADRSNAMVVQKDGSALWLGKYNSTSPNDPPATAAGTRMMWYPEKAAFRAGFVSGSQWDESNIGDYSIALGNSTKASGDNSCAMGWNTAAYGYGSTAMGGYTTASGYHSTAMGRSTKAESYASVAMGRYNVGGGSPNSWISTDPIFEIGIGSSSASEKNALTVLKNGNVGIGTSSPGSHRLNVISNGTAVGGSTGYIKNTDQSGIALSIENSSSNSGDNVLLVTNRGTGDLASFDSWQGTGMWQRRFKFTNGGHGRCDSSWVGGGADYAEFFPKADKNMEYEPGDVISMSGSVGYSVESADAQNPNLVLGVYSTNPVVVGNSSAEKDPDDAVLVGLMGVIPTKVCDENGPLHIGDFLTLSSTPGVAMKATKSGMVIGRAMEDFSGSTTGKIKVYVEVDWVQLDDKDTEIMALRSETEALRSDSEAMHAEAATMRTEIDELKEMVRDLANERSK
jgi:trimeric autotransporter adhesin